MNDTPRRYAVWDETAVECSGAAEPVERLAWRDPAAIRQAFARPGVWVAIGWAGLGRRLAALDLELPASLCDLGVAAQLLESGAAPLAPVALSALPALDDELRAALAAARLERVAALEMAILPAMAQMARGLAIDLPLLATETARTAAEIAALHDTLRAEFGEINFRSNKGMLEVLRQRGLAIDDVKATTLAKYRQAIPALAALMRIRTLEITVTNMKKVAAYADAAGIIHPIYQQIGAQTGRMSCAEPPVQQVSREGGFRRCFVPLPHCRFVIADFSQIQIRIAAVLSQDPAMLELIRTGRDIYRITAAELFGCAPDAVTDLWRKQAKIVVLSTMYGVSPPTLSDNIEAELGIPIGVTLAGEFQKKFSQVYPEFAAWRRRQRADDSDFIVSLWGRRARADRRLPKSALNRTRINWPIQECEADLLKLTLSKMSAKNAALPPDQRGRLALCVHDEILWEAPEAAAAIAARQLGEAMCEATSEYLKLEVPPETVNIAAAWD